MSNVKMTTEDLRLVESALLALEIRTKALLDVHSLARQAHNKALPYYLALSEIRKTCKDADDACINLLLDTVDTGKAKNV